MEAVPRFAKMHWSDVSVFLLDHQSWSKFSNLRGAHGGYRVYDMWDMFIVDEV
jgi:hypothetical protein